MGGSDEEAGEFALVLLRIEVQGHAGDRVAVDLVEVVFADLLFERRLRAADEFLGVDGGLGDLEDGGDVLLLGAADLLVFVGVDHGADAFVGEHLGQQSLVLLAVDDVHAGDAVAAGGGGGLGLGEDLGGEVGLALREHGVELGHGQMTDNFPLMDDPVGRRDVDELGRVQGFGDFEGDGVGVDPEGLSLAVETERRDHRDDAGADELLEEFGVDAFHLAGHLVVQSVEDAERMGDDGVGAGRTEIVRGQALEDLVGQAVRGGEGELQRRLVGHAVAGKVRRNDALLLAQLADLEGGAVDEDDADAERAEDRDVPEEIGEVVIRDDRTVDGDDERLFPEARDVLEDAAKVGWFHECLFGSDVAMR